MLSAERIKARATAIGFDLCGIAPATALPELAYLPEWIAKGYAGEMIYMEKSASSRADVRHFLPSAKSVIVTGTLYNTQEPGTRNQEPGVVEVARYARGEDYHLVLADRLQQLIDWMRAESPEAFEAALFVDKHHVQERVYALHAGIGWIGKNSCVINPGLGSYLFLSGVAVSLPLGVDAPGLDQCGACTLCIDACPTGALVDAHVLDATKCISYLTIELPGSIPEAQRPQIGNHLYGCDICQDVCPWNLAPARSADAAWQATRRDHASATELWQRTDDELHQFVKGSAMTHLSLAGLRRNLATVIGNSGDRSLAAALDRPGRGVKNAAHSAHTPVVQDAVAWAKTRLKATKSEV
jgi:epoxyqueuosine reductase